MVSGQETTDDRTSQTKELRETLTGDRFREWYRERQYRQNIENGTPYFNEAGYVPASERHSPSQLLQCHRKIAYRQANAPAEQTDPDGIFWFGTRFEEDVVFPFLERAVTGPDTYVRNTEWIDLSVDTDEGPLRIKGATDPVIVDGDAVPILPTEVKTKSDIKTLASPNRHHRAQLHAYMAGLSEKFDIELTDGVLLYGSRKSMDVRVFHVTFDEDFWEEVVLDWASEHTRYRLDGELPPASPEYDWECGFCDYRERCGRTDNPYEDTGPRGFLPLYDGYPEDAVREHLDAHPEVELTPTLARAYPDLAETTSVADWECTSCQSRIGWQEVGVDPTPGEPPVCPRCAEDGTLATLQVPTPGFEAPRRSDDA